VVGIVPLDRMTAVGVPTNKPGSTNTGALIAPAALLVNSNCAGRGRNFVISTIGLGDTEAAPAYWPPIVVPPAGAATLPNPPPPATTETLWTHCITTAAKVAPVPARPAAVNVSQVRELVSGAPWFTTSAPVMAVDCAAFRTSVIEAFTIEPKFGSLGFGRIAVCGAAK
jgi:hypothetical protein